jgi:hypothetical protein
MCGHKSCPPCPEIACERKRIYKPAPELERNLELFCQHPRSQARRVREPYNLYFPVGFQNWTKSSLNRTSVTLSSPGLWRSLFTAPRRRRPSATAKTRRARRPTPAPTKTAMKTRGEFKSKAFLSFDDRSRPGPGIEGVCFPPTYPRARYRRHALYKAIS